VILRDPVLVRYGRILLLAVVSSVHLPSVLLYGIHRNAESFFFPFYFETLDLNFS